VYSIALRNKLPHLTSMIAVVAVRDTLRQWATVSRISRGRAEDRRRRHCPDAGRN
jgi:hypothetical protein